MAIDTQPVQTGYQPRYEIVAEQLIAYIASSHLQPGDRLPSVEQLCIHFGVGRTVLREAIRLLSARGYVHARRGSGIYVVDHEHPSTSAVIDLAMTVDPGDVLSLFEFRSTQEVQTARLASERATPRELRQMEEALQQICQGATTGDFEQTDGADTTFHLHIARASHNPFLISAVTTVMRLQHWATQIAIEGKPDSREVSARQHSAIFAAIKAGQPEAAARAMQEHITSVTNDYQEAIRKRVLNEGHER